MWLLAVSQDMLRKHCVSTESCLHSTAFGCCAPDDSLLCVDTCLPGHTLLVETALLNYLVASTQIPVGIACSAPEARVRDTLDTLGLSDSFGAIVTADDVYRGRPDPESYLLAAQQLGRPPVRCVVIGAYPALLAVG